MKATLIDEKDNVAVVLGAVKAGKRLPGSGQAFPARRQPCGMCPFITRLRRLPLPRGRRSLTTASISASRRKISPWATMSTCTMCSTTGKHCKGGREMNFWGYRRPDGRVGIRNKVLILPASVCAADTARLVSSQVKETVTFHNQNGCSQVPSDQTADYGRYGGFCRQSQSLRDHRDFPLAVKTARWIWWWMPSAREPTSPCGSLSSRSAAAPLPRWSRRCGQPGRWWRRRPCSSGASFPISELILGTECVRIGYDQRPGVQSPDRKYL